MKIFKAFVVSFVACVASAASLGTTDDEDLLKAIQSVVVTANKLNAITAKYSEFITDPKKLRQLQDFEDDPSFQLLSQRCGDEIAAATPQNPDQEPSQAVLLAALRCIKEVVVDTFSECYSNFPGVRAPIVCLIDLGFSDEQLAAFTDSDSDQIFINGTDGSEPDSVQDIGAVFGPIPNLNEATCIAIFGTASNPKPAACFSLVDTSDVEEYVAALQNNFAQFQDDCGDYIALTGGSVDIVAPLEYEVDGSDQETANAGLKPFRDNFEPCDETLGISSELEKSYNSSPATAYSLLVASIVSFLSIFLA